MMRCPRCHKDLSDAKTVCPSCGASLDDAATKVFETPPSARTPHSSPSYGSIDDARFVPGTILANRVDWASPRKNDSASRHRCLPFRFRDLPLGIAGRSLGSLLLPPVNLLSDDDRTHCLVRDRLSYRARHLPGAIDLRFLCFARRATVAWRKTA